MTSCVPLWEWPLTKSKTKKPQKNTRGQVRGCKKQQSSMRKPGIPLARIPEITESSRSGTTFTLALRSKHRQRRVATRVVRNEKPVRQEGETWSNDSTSYGTQGALSESSKVHAPRSLKSDLRQWWQNTACTTSRQTLLVKQRSSQACWSPAKLCTFFPSNAMWLPPGRSTAIQACCKWD